MRIFERFVFPFVYLSLKEATSISGISKWDWLIFILLFAYGDKMIFRWMDHSINVDIQTLSAIRSGHFSSTRAGQYLLEVKDQFKPECFFDMICYVQLFPELKIDFYKKRAKALKFNTLALKIVREMRLELTQVLPH